MYNITDIELNRLLLLHIQDKFNNMKQENNSISIPVVQKASTSICKETVKQQQIILQL